MINLLNKIFDRAGLIIFLFVIGLIWQSAAYFELINTRLFPDPVSILITFKEMIGTVAFYNDLGISLIRVFIGLAIGCFFGILIGLLTSQLRIFQQTFGKFLDFLRAIPPVAMLPIFIVWLGIGEVSKITIICWGVFFPVWINTHIGIKAINVNYLRVSQTFKHGVFKRIKILLLPGSLRFIIAGIRISIAIAFILLFVAEFIGANSGIGYRIAESHFVFRVDKMMVGLIFLGVLGYLTDYVFQQIVYKIFPWFK